MKKKLLGLFNTKKLTPEQIYEKTKEAFEESERFNLLTMAKTRGNAKKKADDKS